MAHTLTSPGHPCAHGHKPLVHHEADSHDHDHRPHHGHHHDHDLPHEHRPRQRRAFLFCILLTALMMVVEVIAGILTGSLMLISDAIHMLSHAAALAVSFSALVLAKRTMSEGFPYGLYRIEVIAAFVNGITLAGFTAWIGVEAVRRILSPVEVLGTEMTVVAVIGLAVNAATAVVLLRAGLEDLNTKSAFLHMLGDTVSSVAIVAGGIVITFTGWMVVDPILSMVVAGVIARWSWGLLRDSVLVLLERKPDHLDLALLAAELTHHIPEVKDVHDIHVWEITSQFVCLSAHVVVDDMTVRNAQSIQSRVADLLRHEFRIGHAVIQVEC